MVREDPDVRQPIQQARKHQPLHGDARLVRPPERPPDLVLRLLLARVIGERGASRRVQQDRALEPICRSEQREEALIVQWNAVDVREHLDAQRAEIPDRAFELGDALV
jgi:hypothetical protein